MSASNATRTGLRLNEREQQELHLFLQLPGRFNIPTAVRLELLQRGVLGQYSRTGTFYITELGHQVAQELGLGRR